MSAIDSHQADVAEEDLVDGFTASQVFSNRAHSSITFDDLLLPGQIDFGVEQVDLRTQLTRNISLEMPFVSSPMDSVTEDEMAVAIALAGGVGFIHCQCPPADQADMVMRVKRFENGFIRCPAVCAPTDTLAKLDELGFHGVPITEGGRRDGRLLGFVLSEYGDFELDRSRPLSTIMIPVGEVAKAKAPCSLEEANRILKAEKIKYLPIVDEDMKLVALTTRRDLLKNRDYPRATKRNGRLIVGAACGCEAEDFERAQMLVAAGADILVLDERNGDTNAQVSMLRRLKESFPEVDVVAGNVACARQAQHLIAAGADALRVGMGSGSTSVSQQVKAVGRAQLSAVYECYQVAKAHGVPIIADGGVSSTGAAIKALTVGASVVMMGSLLAGVDESPGDFFFHDGKRLKHFHGLNSVNSIQRRYGQDGGRVASGVSGAVVERGDMASFSAYLAQSVRHGLQDMGIADLESVRNAMDSGALRFELRSKSAQKEGGVHDLYAFKKQLFRA